MIATKLRIIRVRQWARHEDLTAERGWSHPVLGDLVNGRRVWLPMSRRPVGYWKWISASCRAWMTMTCESSVLSAAARKTGSASDHLAVAWKVACRMSMALSMKPGRIGKSRPLSQSKHQAFHAQATHFGDNHQTLIRGL